MCGIVGAIAQRNVTPILLEGLRRLEYRGYDSAGVVVLGPAGLERVRTVGKVERLTAALDKAPLNGALGLAHTRWATHGAPSERNAHPHIAGDRVAVVHNGIIENHAELRAELAARGDAIASDTDSELIAHLISHALADQADLATAVRSCLGRLRGAYAIAVIDRQAPDRMVVARAGSPLVIGVGIEEHFVASDAAALLPVTQQFRYLAEGDVAEIRRTGVRITDRAGRAVERPVHHSQLTQESLDRGPYRHFMLKEIHEQPRVLAETLEGRMTPERVLPEMFGPDAEALFAEVRAVHLVACGTSYHAALVARYWIEALTGIPATAEIASEFRYRHPAVPAGTLLVTLSQSGETADTLAALRLSRELPYLCRLTVCNVPESSLVRESDRVLMTRAGAEIGVASTKAFTTQLVALMLLTLCLGQAHGLAPEEVARIVAELRALPLQVEQVLAMEEEVAALAVRLVHREHALFLGRGVEYPIAMEGALKLKEISYIHAEAYAAGELKHGPLALVSEAVPVIAVAPNNALLEKLLSNLHEVRARGGELLVFAGIGSGVAPADGVTVLELPVGLSTLSPVLFTLPLQLLAYHVAVLKGTDVDRPRNLAKSVTVE
ncbi:MAG TPA: glutamine--fructose-6-phosphate transaminase (isomerizing) [Candidatus Acidoferrales bacterium]|nr:glutamine--fructose-6-phosphate transaminase (isomerizing) [Candidatus Acidoferrales bacterium]